MSCARTLFTDSVRRLSHWRRPLVQAISLGLLAVAAAGPAWAEDEVFKIIPGKAMGFVIVNKPASADAKLQQLGRQINAPIPSLLALLEGPGGARAGFDKQQPIALLFLPPKAGALVPVIIAFTPVTDYAKFLEQFKPEETKDGISKVQIKGKPAIFRGIGRYAAITDPAWREALADLKAVDEVPASVASWRPWLAKQDVAGVVLSPGIQMISRKVQQNIAAAKMMMPQGNGQAKQAVAGLDMYVHFFKAAEKQVAAFGIGIQRDDQGVIRLAQRAALVPGESWAQSIGVVKPAEQDVLAGLPVGPFIFAGGGPLGEAAMPGLMNWSFGLIKNMRELYGLSEEQAEKISELSKQKFPPVRGMSMILGLGAGDEPLLGRTIGVMRTDNGKTFLADYEKFIAPYNKVAEQIESPVFRPIGHEKAEIDGMAAIKISMTVPQMPNMPPQTAKMMESMYGRGGKMSAWVVPCNEHTVIFSYASGQSLREAIAGVKEGKPGLAADAGVAKVSALLPREAAWRIYCSPKGLLEFVKRTMRLALPPGAKVNIPEFAATPPVGVGIVTGHDEVEAQVIVPPEVLREITRLIVGRQ